MEHNPSNSFFSGCSFSSYVVLLFLDFSYFICFGRWDCLPRKSCMGRLTLLIQCRRLPLYFRDWSGVFYVKVPQRVWITCHGVIALHPCLWCVYGVLRCFFGTQKILLINGVGVVLHSPYIDMEKFCGRPSIWPFCEIFGLRETVGLMYKKSLGGLTDFLWRWMVSVSDIKLLASFASFNSFWMVVQRMVSWWCTNYTKFFCIYGLSMFFNNRKHLFSCLFGWVSRWGEFATACH